MIDHNFIHNFTKMIYIMMFIKGHWIHYYSSIFGTGITSQDHAFEFLFEIELATLRKEMKYRRKKKT